MSPIGPKRTLTHTPLLARLDCDNAGVQGWEKALRNAFAAFALAVVCACSEPPAARQEQRRPETIHTILGGAWYVVSVGEQTFPPSVKRPLLFFTEGRAVFHGGCSQSSARYVGDLERFRFELTPSSTDECVGVYAKRNQAVLQALAATTSIRVIDPDRLQLLESDQSSIVISRRGNDGEPLDRLPATLPEGMPSDQLLEGNWEVVSVRAAMPYHLRWFATLTFDANGNFSAVGCRTISGKYSGAIADFKVVPSKGLSTYTACIGPGIDELEKLDRDLVEGLRMADRIQRVDARRIRFVAADGTEVLVRRFDYLPMGEPSTSLLSLVKGKWVSTSLDGSSRSLPFEFASDGRLKGSDGCNAFEGKYSGEPGRLRFWMERETLLACTPRPPFVYFDFAAVRRISATSIEILGPNGHSLVLVRER